MNFKRLIIFVILISCVCYSLSKTSTKKAESDKSVDDAKELKTEEHKNKNIHTKKSSKSKSNEKVKEQKEKTSKQKKKAVADEKEAKKDVKTKKETETKKTQKKEPQSPAKKTEDEGPHCTYKGFYAKEFQAEQCSTAREACTEEEKYDKINFFAMFFCTFGGSLWIFMPVTIFFMFILFRFISQTVEEYVAPSITYITEYFKISESLAAVTLLALANGAGDVITAIVAGSVPGGAGLAYNIGALYGAGFFVISIVIYFTIKKSPSLITVTKGTFYRDIGLYIVATIVTLFFAFQGILTVASAIIFLAIYLLLVIIVAVQDYFEKKETKQEDLTKSILDNKKDEQNVLKAKKVNQKVAKMFQKAVNKIKIQNMIIMKFKCRMEERSQRFENMDLVDKLFYIVDFPFMYIRKFTIPPAEEEKYSNILLTVWPIAGVFFIIASLTAPAWWWVYLGIPVIVGLVALFYLTQKSNQQGQVPSYYFAVEMLVLFLGLLWTFIACSILIDILNSYIVIFKLNNTYMGLTILGVGNALPDALTTVALAKQGYAQMGITGSYAGQLFGLLVGFGLSLLKTTLTSGPQNFPLFSNFSKYILDTIVISFLFICLVTTFVIGLYNQCQMTNGLGVIIMLIYVVFIIIATLIQVYYLIEGNP